MRHTPHRPAISLPAITKSSFRYLNSLNAVEKAYADTKKTSKENHSKLYLLDGRPKKRYDFPFR